MISVQGTFVPTLVSSVFGRTGDVVAESGDYTPEQVGAAAKEHAEKHATGGTDPITPESIGALTLGNLNGILTGDGSGTLGVAIPGEDYAEPAKTSSITLTAAGWTGDTSPYTQSITIAGSTAHTKVDLQPDASAIAQLITDGVAGMYIANDGGTLTAYAVSAKPTVDLTIQTTLTEVTEG